MNRFDKAFDNEQYPQILLEEGWKSLGKMSYSFGRIKILFDTSTTIQVEKPGEAIIGYSPRTEEEFTKIVNDLMSGLNES